MYSCYMLVTILALEVVPNSTASSVKSHVIKNPYRLHNQVIACTDTLHVVIEPLLHRWGKMISSEGNILWSIYLYSS